MYGIYLRCDKCNTATIGGEEVTPRQQGVPTLKRSEGATLRARAAALGWKVPGGNEDFDLCPACCAKWHLVFSSPMDQGSTLKVHNLLGVPVQYELHIDGATSSGWELPHDAAVVVSVDGDAEYTLFASPSTS